MSNEMHLILTRRREVEQEIARAKAVIALGQKELLELDMAGAVVARLSGASWPPSGEDNGRPATEVRLPGPAELTMTADAPKVVAKSLPEMIEEVLSKAHRRGLRMMEPKEIKQEIINTLDPNVRPEAVSSISWRMWKRGQLEKVEGTSAYRLPQNENPSDDAPAGVASEGLLSSPAQGREAGPGGGT